MFEQNIVEPFYAKARVGVRAGAGPQPIMAANLEIRARARARACYSDRLFYIDNDVLLHGERAGVKSCLC